MGLLRGQAAVRRREFFQRLAFTFDADFDVNARGLDVGVSEPVFDDGDIVSGFNEMERRGMAVMPRTA